MIIHTVADTAPVWTFRLKSRGGAFELTAPGAEVEARVRLADDSIVSTDAEIVDAAGGVITVAWGAADLDIVGAAKLEFLYTATGGVVQHSRTPMDVYVRPEYSDPETP